MFRRQSGQGFAAEIPEKDTKGRIDSSSLAPIPDTLSSRSRLPNGPCSVRHATIRWANAGPTWGRRVISLTSARSMSMCSPGSRGRASCEARRAVSRSALGREAEGDCSCTSPGGVEGDGEMKYRIPAPAKARQASRRAARRSSIPSRCGHYRSIGVPKQRRHHQQSASSPRSPCRSYPPSCANRDSRNPQRRSRGCRPSAARHGRR